MQKHAPEVSYVMLVVEAQHEYRQNYYIPKRRLATSTLWVTDRADGEVGIIDWRYGQC